MLPFSRSLSEARELPLPADVIDKWLGLNAAALLGI
jgi:predicted TIM-barrel fold metal-dependent hydrolase